MSKDKNPDKFIRFKEDLSKIELPEKFTFPFYYTPHPVAKFAVKQLQFYLKNNKIIKHNFGLESYFKNKKPIGKMFGVLVVKNKVNELGFLAAFSGKIADSNTHQYFVPPVYDMLSNNGFYLEEVDKLKLIIKKINEFEASEDFINAKKEYEKLIVQKDKAIELQRIENTNAKKLRKQKRQEIANLSEIDKTQILQQLSIESQACRYKLKDLIKFWDKKIEPLRLTFKHKVYFKSKLKELRKTHSNYIQEKLFEQYNFINKFKDYKNVKEIFADTFFKIPPAGAGECAAPKLLQYAFLNDLQPIALAEFWWGQSPRDIIRKHNHFYPACRGKCEPILNFMLEGIELEKNPLLENYGKGKKVEILYEEETFAVVLKPYHFLSAPGKHIEDSVWLRMKNHFPAAQGPIIVHRLDMATSGIMLIAKTKEAYKNLQAQFINRSVKKRYTALLNGKIEKETGTINLPLRGDMNDRPRQMVCLKYGKKAATEFKKLKEINGKTLVHFFPITGRTHQLRMHASHPNGLNTPIVGDVLYGTKANRLHLHASYIKFTHPENGTTLEFEYEIDF